jgi:hypothetical protein
MPVKRTTKTAKPVKMVESESEDEIERLEVKLPVTFNSKSDSDRVQLAQAINNLTVKGEQFVEALNSFSQFKETILQLDLQLESKKRDYIDQMTKLEKAHTALSEQLTQKHEDESKKLKQEYAEWTKQLDDEYKNLGVTLQQNYKNNQIEVQQKLLEFKLRGCEEIAKQNGMLVVKEEDHNVLIDNAKKANKELDALQKSFDNRCNTLKQEEKSKYELELKHQISTLELNHKANIAEMKAKIEQQTREITMLNKTIDTLKNEITEQRTLTKEIAQAGSKAQIQQKFGKD